MAAMAAMAAMADVRLLKPLREPKRCNGQWSHGKTGYVPAILKWFTFSNTSNS